MRRETFKFWGFASCTKCFTVVYYVIMMAPAYRQRPQFHRKMVIKNIVIFFNAQLCAEIAQIWPRIQQVALNKIMRFRSVVLKRETFQFSISTTLNIRYDLNNCHITLCCLLYEPFWWWTGMLWMDRMDGWISNHIHYKVWDEITHPFLNFNGATVEV